MRSYDVAYTRAYFLISDGFFEMMCLTLGHTSLIDNEFLR